MHLNVHVCFCFIEHLKLRVSHRLTIIFENSVSEYEQHSQSLIVQHCVDFCDRLLLHHCVRVRLSFSKLFLLQFGNALEEPIVVNDS